MVRKSKKNEGFTLIELLVVIAILGLIASIILISLRGVMAKTRDVRRLMDIKEIEKALRLYREQTGSWPDWQGGDNGDGCPDIGGTWDRSNNDADGDSKPFIEFLEDSKYFSRTPLDPLNNGNGCGSGSHTYVFYVKQPGYQSCPTNRGKFYLLGVSDMETSSGIHPSSPQFQCGDMVWHTKFEYLTGGFEY